MSAEGSVTGSRTGMRVVAARRRLLMGAALLAAGKHAAAQGGSGTLRDVAMGLASNSFATAPARLARDLGLFRAHGLEPRLVVLDSASAATTALISRSVAFALSGPAELVVAQARGQQVTSVANVYAGLSGTLVLARSAADRLGIAPDAPPAARLRALDGLTIASPSATGAYTVAARGAAKASGVALRFVYMALPAMPAALESGAIQGYVAGAPFWSVAVARGTGVVWMSGPRGDFPEGNSPANSANLQVMRDVAAGSPELVRDVTAVFRDFSAAIRERPDAVKAALARLYPDLDGTTVDLLFASESQAWAAGPPTPDGMARDIAFTRSAGIPLPDDLDPRSMILQ